MATWGCVGCRTSYRVRLFRCPRCHGTAFEEESMPKATRASGASNAAAERGQEAAARPPATGGIVENLPVVGEDVVPVAVDEISPLAEEEVEEVERIAAAHEGEGQRIVVLGEEESSLGSSSETSPEKPPTSPVTSGSALPRRARTTASRSSKGRTGSSTARSTDSSGEADVASENE